MSKIIWFTLFGVLFASLPFSVLGIDLSRLYGHLGPPVQKRSGGCINSSPAIAIGAEQQFGDDSSFGNSDNSNGVLSNVDSIYTTITAITAACLLIVTVFVVIFAALQRNSYGSHKNVKYNKLSKGKRSYRSGTTTTTLAIASGDDDGDLEPMMASTLNFSDDDQDDEQNGNETTFYANT